MEHPGESLPGWSLGYTYGSGHAYAKLETESGRFTATWYTDAPEERAHVTFNKYIYHQSRHTYSVAPTRSVGWFPVDEVVGQCLLFDTGR